MAKRRYEKIDLFGRRFTLDTKNSTSYQPIPSRDIFDVYGRPSSTKVSIYNDWRKWFEDNNGWCDICSHNSNFFSIQGYVRNYETRQMYFCYITYANNYCVEIENDLI